MSEVIWLLTKGSYSDYTVLCACKSKTEADDLCRRYNASDGARYDTATVEEIWVGNAETTQVSILRITQTLWDDGDEADYFERVSIEWPFDSLYGDVVPVRWRWVRAPVHHGKGGRLEVSGTDHERVRKVYSERRALIKTDAAFASRREVSS